MTVRELLVAKPVEGTLTLDSYPTDATPLVDGKSQAKDDLEEMGDRLFDLHELMFANRQTGLLLVLQGTDASGKNGTIKHVINRVNPAGVSVTEFGPPTEEELEHHFLWRIRPRLPEPGTLGVFARSHYEDLIVPIAEGSEDEDEIESRYSDIAKMESELTSQGIHVVKCLLNISYDEQRDRLLRRLRRDDKRWKFEEGDIETRRKWDAYQLARGQMIARTSTEEAPWYIIPADHKWYRNWAIARLLVEVLEEMDLAYPQPDLDLDALREALND